MARIERNIRISNDSSNNSDNSKESKMNSNSVIPSIETIKFSIRKNFGASNRAEDISSILVSVTFDKHYDEAINERTGEKIGRYLNGGLPETDYARFTEFSEILGSIRAVSKMAAGTFDSKDTTPFKHIYAYKTGGLKESEVGVERVESSNGYAYYTLNRAHGVYKMTSHAIGMNKNTDSEYDNLGSETHEALSYMLEGAPILMHIGQGSRLVKYVLKVMSTLVEVDTDADPIYQDLDCVIYPPVVDENGNNVLRSRDDIREIKKNITDGVIEGKQAYRRAKAMTASANVSKENTPRVVSVIDISGEEYNINLDDNGVYRIIYNAETGQGSTIIMDTESAKSNAINAMKLVDASLKGYPVQNLQ